MRTTKSDAKLPDEILGQLQGAMLRGDPDQFSIAGPEPSARPARPAPGFFRQPAVILSTAKTWVAPSIFSGSDQAGLHPV